VIHLGSGRMTMDSGTPQPVYRLMTGDANTPPRSPIRFLPRTTTPSVHQFQASQLADKTIIPVSQESVPRVVSYRIHPVRSEADFGRSGAVYSSEWHAPVSQYQSGPDTCTPGSSSGGWTTGNQEDQYQSRFAYLFVNDFLVHSLK